MIEKKQTDQSIQRVRPGSLKQKMLPALVAAFALLATSSAAGARTVICESNAGQTQFCPADTRGGVRLSKQFSKSGCYEGETWGYDRQGIWVSDGCRGKFDTIDSRPERYGGSGPYGHEYRHPDEYQDRYRDDYRPRNPATLTCESWDDREKYCRARLRGGQVEVARQLSKTPCRYGDNWGWDGGGIWVRGGCRAVFSIY